MRNSTLVILALFISACRKSNTVPAYIDIPSVQLSTTSGQGASTSKITDVWVSVDGTFNGVWELPARIPVLAEGSHEIEVVPAIKRNGMFDDRLRYPFYQGWAGNSALVKEGSVTVHPIVTYIPQTVFWIEDFVDPFSHLVISDDSDTTLMNYVPALHPEIEYADATPCSGFTLTSGRPYIRLETDENFAVFGGPVFVEFDYRSDMNLVVGALYSQSGTPYAQPLVTVVPSLRSNGSLPWSKIHIDLSNVFNLGVSYRDVYFEARLPSGVASGQVFLDNIKLLRINA
ncbi:MAG TPA: hypothetical protein PK760_04455 [Flavobacteriales bacterium]|nr:hypothetical protein [Flavobacteriales bacterium]